jgi:hypothetical protein
MNLWDTSALAKLHVAETDSAQVAAVLAAQQEIAVVSHLAETELWSALIAKELNRQVPRGFARLALDRYRQSLADGLLLGVAVNARVHEAAEEAVRRCARGKSGFALRAMDALHLGTALISRCDTVVSTDLRQRQGAVALGLRVLPA